jgi:hypothetical protein
MLRGGRSSTVASGPTKAAREHGRTRLRGRSRKSAVAAGALHLEPHPPSQM